ncbi:MAG: NAD(+)/NADH kinase, partial [Candidatus Caldarchaeum sp.]
SSLGWFIRSWRGWLRLVKILVVYASTRPEAVAAAKKVENFLQTKTSQYSVLSLSEFDEKHPTLGGEIVMVLGGDGTMLRVARRISSPDVKLFGVNFGRAGFLSTVEPAELEEACKRITDEDYYVEKVMRLSIYADGEFLADALNEAYVSSRKPGKIIEYRLLQREQLASDVADGVILATPVGSTAYAFSTGGPIVDERLESVVVAPMASMTNLRPMVLSIELPVTVFVVKGEAQVMVDGHTTKLLQEGKVVVEKSPRSLSFISFDERRLFSRRLRKRLYGRP